MLVSCACLNEIVGKEMKTMRPGDHSSSLTHRYVKGRSTPTTLMCKLMTSNDVSEGHVLQGS